MSDTFSTMVDKERERLQQALADLQTKQDELESQRAALERELNALDAYEAARSGKAKRGKAGKRAPRGARQQVVLDVVAKYRKGISRGGILEAMGLKGDKAGEQSVSNALTSLKKAKKVMAKDGKYMAG